MPLIYGTPQSKKDPVELHATEEETVQAGADEVQED